MYIYIYIYMYGTAQLQVKTRMTSTLSCCWQVSCESIRENDLADTSNSKQNPSDSEPSHFLTNTTGLAQELFHGCINSSSCILLNCTAISCRVAIGTL